MMSHEIRTPMNAIIGMSEIAKKSNNPDKINECLTRIDDASVHLLGIINDILDMSKMEAGKFELSLSDFDLEGMLNRIISINQVRFEQKEQEFTIVIDHGVPQAIIADQQRLAQVITNLLSNAAKFTPNKGNITLFIRSQKETTDTVNLCFEVKDEGIGITKEQQSHLFQAFQQADSSITRRFGGTGLGLAISKNIVEMMGGFIRVESVVDYGSSFIFEIPVKKGTFLQPIQLDTELNLSKLHFLVVDDSEYVLQYFKIMSSSLGIQCDAVSTSDEVFQCLETKQYNLIFIDFSMPKIDGLTLARFIQEKYENQNPIIMSNISHSDLETQANDMGIKSLINKPLLPSIFIECINHCLGKSKEPLKTPDFLDETDKNIFLGRCMLLADDLLINREIIKTIVEETGIEVVEAANGKAACELFEKHSKKFDIILMDVHMPIIDGYSAVKTIRNMNHLANASVIPILAMTADVLKEDIIKCKEAGMNDCIEKPINTASFILKLKHYLSC